MTAHSTLTRSGHGLSTQLGDDWRAAGRCRPGSGVDPELFHPVGTSAAAIRQTRKAKAICRACPVRAECLQDALDNEVADGIWGGLDANERGRIRTLDREATTCTKCRLPMVARMPGQTRCMLCRPAERALPVVAVPGRSNRPGDHHDTVIRLLSGTPRATYAQVATVIGGSTEAVKAYWRRHLDRIAREQEAELCDGQPPVEGALLIDRWVTLHAADPDLNNTHAARRLGVSRDSLNTALYNARRAGDPRVPPALASRQHRRKGLVAA